ncbi:hypothetical protein B0H14DRAFT_3755173 [Mycena olivaceomarginata]|nr:hypothetical protein B0H14DRAFT_3755173 [Mycena olivaceomarginata]
MATPQEQHTRVALVTGAAQGIGRAIALRLANDGLDVAVNDLHGKIDSLNAVVEEIRRLGRRAFAVTSDVSKEDEVKDDGRGSPVCSRSLGCDGRQRRNSWQRWISDVEKWEQLWEINIRGVLLCYKYAARQMVKQGAGGRIIGASSICGLRGYANAGAYCISKAAVRSLTQTTALELREHSITCNAYAPGVIETSMTFNEADKDHGPGFGTKSLLKVTDFRTGQPADVAAVVSFLASPDSHFVTGQTISVDDGVNFS